MSEITPGIAPSKTIRLHRVDGPLRGEIRVPGDKSISHRALFLGGLNHGSTTLQGLAPGADVGSTMEVLAHLGVRMEVVGHVTRIQRSEPVLPPVREQVVPTELYCGNSGTTARLVAGYLAGREGVYRITGDESLTSRPMERVVEPLRRMGLRISSTSGHLPVTVIAQSGTLTTAESAPVLDAASAQVHAAIALAALSLKAPVSIRRTAPMRDHTLRLLRLFGIELETRDVDGFQVDTIPPAEIAADVSLTIPGDFSSAAFWAAAALLVPGSRIRIASVGLNTSRIAFLHAIRAMGGKVEITVHDDSIEPGGSVTVSGDGTLTGIEIDAQHHLHPVPLMIDELPLLALLGARARGQTVVRGAQELRTKETDRIAGIVALLRSLGVEIQELEDGFIVNGPQSIHGGSVDPRGDHRLAMVAAIASLVVREPVDIVNPEVASISYPSFWSQLERLAGRANPRNDTGRA